MIEAKLWDPQIKMISTDPWSSLKSPWRNTESGYMSPLSNSAAAVSNVRQCNRFLDTSQYFSFLFSPPGLFFLLGWSWGCPDPSWRVSMHPFFQRQDTFAGLSWADSPRPLQHHHLGGCPLVFCGAGRVPLCMPTPYYTRSLFPWFPHSLLKGSWDVVGTKSILVEWSVITIN